MPLTSVVIPAYNAQSFISTSIQSVLNQTLNNVEVIVVDDGSTDETVRMVNQFDDRRIKLIRQTNQGQSAAINKGAEHAEGVYIKLLDADDWLNPEHLAAQTSAINDSSDQVASCRWGYFVNDFGNPITRQEHTHQDYDSPLEWIVDSLTKDEGMMGGWTWLIPRQVWDRAGGFDPRLSLNNDFHFTIKLLLASKGVRFATDAIYSYRKGLSGALSGSSGVSAMESAYLTTDLGTQLLLEREDSPRIRKICADRFQQWLFRFYPEYPELASQASKRIVQLGGSDFELQGGVLMKFLLPLLGWKGVRKLQSAAYRHGWQSILNRKAAIRLKNMEKENHG